MLKKKFKNIYLLTDKDIEKIDKPAWVLKIVDKIVPM